LITKAPDFQGLLYFVRRGRSPDSLSRYGAIFGNSFPFSSLILALFFRQSSRLKYGERIDAKAVSIVAELPIGVGATSFSMVDRKTKVNGTRPADLLGGLVG
jgi:hypothetical protein